MKKKIFEHKDIDLRDYDSLGGVIQFLSTFPRDAWLEFNYSEYSLEMEVCWNRDETDEEYEKRIANQIHLKELEKQRKKKEKTKLAETERREYERLKKKYGQQP